MPETTRVYIFRCSANARRLAASTDQSGANLPADECAGGTWEAFKNTDLAPGETSPRAGIDQAAMRTAIVERGWYVWERPLQS